MKEETFKELQTLGVSLQYRFCSKEEYDAAPVNMRTTTYSYGENQYIIYQPPEAEDTKLFLLAKQTKSVQIIRNIVIAYFALSVITAAISIIPMFVQ